MPIKKTETIDLQPLAIETIRIDIKGVTPLIVHAWSEKSKQQMREKQPTRKEPRNPDQEFENSMYRLPDGGHAMPVTAFKQASVNGARNYRGITMVQARQAMYFIGDQANPLMQRLTVSDPVMREDICRVGIGSADLRYRAMYEDWAATLTIRYLPTIITTESIVNLVDAGGVTSGVGEWRQERNGQFGHYAVVGTK